MTLSLRLLETRVARRLLLLFLLCALLPTATLAVLAYNQVVTRLDEQSRERLREASKNSGMALTARLQIAESDLRAFAASTDARHVLDLDSTARLTALVWTAPGHESRVLAGQLSAPLPLLSDSDREHLASGHSVLAMSGDQQHPVLLLATASGGAPGAVLWGEVRQQWIWGDLDNPDAPLQMAVLASDNSVMLVGPRTPDDRIPPALARARGRGDFSWSDANGKYLAGYWTAFFRYDWNAPGWTIILSEPMNRVFAPLVTFRRTFVLVVLTTLVLVFLMSNMVIRRRLQPLVELQEGTDRVAEGHFEHRVTIRSADEFERLGGSFNQMAERLGRQFSALGAINEMGRAILSELKTDRLAETVLTRFNTVLPARGVSLVLQSPGPLDDWSARVLEGGREYTRQYRIRAADQLLLRRITDYQVLDGPETRRELVPFLELPDGASVLVLPLEHDHELAGFIALAFDPALQLTADDRTNARQLANQVGVALANARLLERLETLSWGTLAALARTIDANSSWTAGHSERVTRLSLALGRELKVSELDLDRLHRGGLLHDIGKIGIPGALLDKPGRLTDEEMAIIRQHPVTGAEILAPIPVFSDIIPIVRHHHEKLDGTGYPDGLARAGIPYLARIVAVADVYDALVSERPYREGWSPERAIGVIRESAGSHHDPAMVEALIAIHQRGELSRLPELPSIQEPALTVPAGVNS